MSLKNKITSYLKATRYNIGFVRESLSDVTEGRPISVRWLRHNYKDRWFADPFILDANEEEIIVLVEEWYDPIGRGRISKLTIDRHTLRLKGLKVMIEEPYHLSFPAIDRRADGLYIFPECGKTGPLYEYRYDTATDSFTKTGVLADEPLADAVVNRIFGSELLFATKLPDANGKELGIYRRDRQSGRFTISEHYHFEENISRMAGNFFEQNGKVYRPAQVCIKSYGDAVSIQEVTHHEDQWQFNELRRIYPPHPDLDLGFHTFNTYKGLIVVDAVGYRRAKLGHLLRFLKHTIKK